MESFCIDGSDCHRGRKIPIMLIYRYASDAVTLDVVNLQTIIPGVKVLNGYSSF